MRKLKIGDKVKVIRKPIGCDGCKGRCMYLKKIGIVKDITSKIYYGDLIINLWVSSFDETAGGCSGFTEADLEIVNKKIKEYGIVAFMRKITISKQ